MFSIYPTRARNLRTIWYSLNRYICFKDLDPLDLSSPYQVHMPHSLFVEIVRLRKNYPLGREYVDMIMYRPEMKLCY